MEHLYKETLALVRASIHQTDYTPDEIFSWNDACGILATGKLTGIVYQKICQLPASFAPEPEVLNIWKTTVFQRGLRQMFSLQELKYVLQEAEKRGLHPIVFKGIALATLYPEANMRFSSDADILISSKERLSMETLLQELGYLYVDGSSKDHVPVYKIQEGNRVLKIELHDCLWEDYTGVQAEFLEELQLTAPETLLHTTACNIPITTLGYEQHLIYQIFHIAKHFAFEGLPLRYLVDITLYVNAYHQEINSSHFWDVMKKLKYDVFCDAIFKICVHYLGMTDVMMSTEYEKHPFNEALLVDILTAGREVSGASENWAATDTLALYFMRNTKATTTHSSQKLHMLFPGPSELKDKFSYAKKYKFLLPVAWVHRLFSAVSYALYCKKQGTSSKDAYSKIDQRLELLKDLEMVEVSE